MVKLATQFQPERAAIVDNGPRKYPVISGQGATKTLTPVDSGSLCLFDRAAGIVYTLPEVTADNGVIGTFYDFLITTTITSNAAKVITGAAADVMIGTIVSIDTDSSDAAVGFSANGSTHIAISQNGTTTGGVLGTAFRLTAVSATQWLVEGTVRGSGTVATPFATS